MKKERTSSGVLVIRDRQQAAAVLNNATRNRSRYRVASIDDRTLDGVVYDSAKEMNHHAALMILERTGEITNLRRQVPYDLIVNGMLVGRYFADHVYIDHTGKEIIEDSKGSKETTTEIFKLKKKLMLACHGINVIEVY